MGSRNLNPDRQLKWLWWLCFIVFAGTSVLIISIVHFKHKQPKIVITSPGRTIHFEFDSSMVAISKEPKKKTIAKNKPPIITVPYTSPLEDPPIIENDNPATEYSQSFSIPSIEKIIMLPHEDENNHTEPVYYEAENMPSFNGGKFDTFRDWIATHLRYPDLAAENGISGKVIIRFAVNANGAVCDVQVVKGVDPSLDEEAIRIISSSPRWTPGKIKGKPVKVQFSFPVVFELK